MSEAKIIVIGGGIVGLATAYKLLLLERAVVTVLEKEERVALHQSGNNSGVMHAGLYYRPGSLKARLAVCGIRQMKAFCQENGVAHEVCGKLVVATHERETPILRDLMERGLQNGLSGLRWLGPDEISEIEPHARGVAALQVPEEGITDYSRVCSALAAKIEQRGGRIVTRAKVTGLKPVAKGWVAQTMAGDFEAAAIVNCAGLHSDRVAALAGEKSPLQIVPFRGQYYKLRKERESLVRNLIYPVPDPAFPFLGVHFTRLIHEGVEAGPNAALAFAREGYKMTNLNIRDMGEAALFPGLWRFILRHTKVCLDEVGQSLSKERFCNALRRLVPDVRPDDLEAGGAGVRAQAILPTGEMVNDFYFLERPGALHVLNAPSPGATASLAIGDEIARRLAGQLS